MASVLMPSIIEDKLRPHAKETLEAVKRFVEEECIPADTVFEAQLSTHPDQRSKSMPPILEDLKQRARQLGLWNLWMHSHLEEGPGLTNVEYTLMCEIMGRSLTLAKYGNEQQKMEWLRPFMDGKVRSAYVMTEPTVAASDAESLALEMRREGNEYILNGV
ncbi:acyl-CoA dehydrogenase, partial [Cladophialophora psammophila CBS 110553]